MFDENQPGNAGSLNPLIQRVAFSSDHAACTVAAHPTYPLVGATVPFLTDA